jgi:hypothetical protein
VISPIDKATADPPNSAPANSQAETKQIACIGVIARLEIAAAQTVEPS